MRSRALVTRAPHADGATLATPRSKEEQRRRIEFESELGEQSNRGPLQAFSQSLRAWRRTGWRPVGIHLRFAAT